MHIWSLARAREAVNRLDLTPLNREVAAYWLTLWDGSTPPQWRKFQARKLKHRLSAIAVFEVLPGERVTCRIAGSYYKLALGFELTGMDLIALTPEKDRAHRWKNISLIMEGAVSAASRSIERGLGLVDEAEELILPFADIGDDGCGKYLVHADWRPDSEQWALEQRKRTHTTLCERQRIEPFHGSDGHEMEHHSRAVIGG
jgi:hypothetical protein